MVSWANFDILEYLSYEDIYFKRVLTFTTKTGPFQKEQVTIKLFILQSCPLFRFTVLIENRATAANPFDPNAMFLFYSLTEELQ